MAPPSSKGLTTTSVTTSASDPATLALENQVNNETTEEEQALQNQENDETTEKEQAEQTCLQKYWKKCVTFYLTYEFLVLVVVVILLAKAYPPLGATYLAPQITATWIAVVFIFVLAGLGLKTEEFKKAFKRMYFNAFVQCFNFGVVSSIVFGFSRLLASTNVITKSLADGMVVCSSLPLTINMVLVLTKNAGGDEASAIFNAAFGNLVGVFLSPILILGYLGVTGGVDLLSVFVKLALRVVLPIAIGQLLQKTSTVVVEFVKKYKKKFKKAQMYCLVFIVYTVFCRTFDNGSDASIGDIFLMILFQFILLVGVMILAWFALKLFFPNQPTLRVMGLFGCTHKTVAMGVPLINAIYEDNPNVGLYTLPLLIWHPMQLVIGTVLVPRLNRFVVAEKERLGIKDDDDDDDEKLVKDEEQPHEIAAMIEGEEGVEVEQPTEADAQKKP